MLEIKGLRLDISGWFWLLWRSKYNAKHKEGKPLQRESIGKKFN